MNKKISHYFSCYWNLKKKYKYGFPLCIFLLVFYYFCLPNVLFDVPYSTVVSDRNNNLLGARIADDHQWRFPIVDSLPEKYKIAVVAFEDQYFYSHWGVNPLAIGRAMKQNFSSNRIVSGGSTLTMQTIRLARKEKRTYFEKLIEVIQATRLEFRYSKDEILNLYASHAPMGGNVVGIEAASWRYFGHSNHNLSWAEAAILAILPNSPSMMHFGKNRDKLLSKRNRLLQTLYERGNMNKTDYELSVAEPLPPNPLPLPQIAPHLVSKIHKEANGKRVKTTVDKYYQQQVEMILSKWNAEFSKNQIHNIAAIVLDVQRNEVVAYCGNVNFSSNGHGNQVDVLQAPRSTGSILKPFLYAAMLQEGLLMPNELLPDVPINISGFAPKNFSLKYDGAVSASTALARSLNIPSVLSLKKYSVPKFYNLLKKAQFSHLQRSADNYGLSLILGGAEASMWDISFTYLDLVQSVTKHQSNDFSRFSSPNYILEIDNEELKGQKDRDHLFHAGASYLTLEALTDVVRPEELDWKDIPSVQKISWKTGTSFGFRDALAVGATPRFVVGVWVGNSNGEGRPGLIGARTAGMVLFDIFNTLPSSPWFAIPETDLIQSEVCKESGMLRSVNCPESSIELKYLPEESRYTATCQYHQLVHLSDDERYRVFQECVGNRGLHTESWFILPPIWEWYYKNSHPEYKKLPPFSPECTPIDKGEIFDFIYPYPNITIAVPKQLDGSLAQIVFEIAHRKPDNIVYWHLDDQFIGSTTGIHKVQYTPPPGKHRLTVVDESGFSKSVRFTVQ